MINLELEDLINELSERPKDSIIKKETDVIWYKYINPTGEFYSPFAQSKTTAKAFDSASEMVEELNKNSIRESYFRILSRSLLFSLIISIRRINCSISSSVRFS